VADERGSNQTLALIRADLSSQFLVGELDVLFAEHSQELVDVEIEQSELRVGIAAEVKHHKTVAVADDTLDAEVVDGGHLRRDVVVLEVLRHLRKPAATAETEERASGGRESGKRRRGRTGAASVVHVDDALATHTERKATVFVKYSVTRQRTLRKSSRF